MATNSDGHSQQVLQNQNYSPITISILYSSHSIHLINKLRTAKKCTCRNGTIERLQVVSLSVESDKTVPNEQLSPN